MGGISLQLPVEFDAVSQRFTFHLFLPADAKSRIELRGFRAADGGTAAPITLEYQVGKELFLPEQEARIAEAGRSAKLREVVEAVRRNRLSMKSLEETVCATCACDELDERLGWESAVSMRRARFAFQGDRQFFADASNQGSSKSVVTSYQVGSDGQECWGYSAIRRLPNSDKVEKEVQFCPYGKVHDKYVTIADPFGAKRFASTEKAIASLKLEYLGQVEWEGRTCHRIRSWAGSADDECFLRGFYDWLIDARSLLPVVCDAQFVHYGFLYGPVNQPIAQEAFRPPTGTDIKRKPSEFEKGFDRFWRLRRQRWRNGSRMWTRCEVRFRGIRIA